MYDERAYYAKKTGQSTGSLTDLQVKYWGSSGSLADREKAFYKSNSIAGSTLDDMRRNYWVAQGSGLVAANSSTTDFKNASMKAYVGS